VSRSHLLTLCAGALGLAGASWVLAQPPVPPKKTALVARAYDNRHDDLAAGTVKSLSGAGIRLTEALLRRGWDVRFLETRPAIVAQPPADERPTAANLRKYLKGLGPGGAVRRGDEVMVVLIGHLVALEAEEAKGKRASRYYFCPQDAAYRGLKRAAEVKGEHRLLALDDLYGYLHACPAQKKLLVLVTALSGRCAAEEYAPPLCPRLPKLPPPPAGLAVLTSCAEGEFTSYNADFLDAFQEGLGKGEADGALGGRPPDGAITLQELVAYVQARVRKEAGSHGRLSFPQNPQLLGSPPRGWVLAGKAAEPAGPLLRAPFPPKAARQRQEQLAKELKLPAPVVSNSIGMKLALIPPVEFRMGSEQGGYEDERPRVRVRLARPFLLGQHEVTQGQFRRVMGANPSHFQEVAGQDTAAFPVEQVTYKEAVLFCNALSAREKLPPYYALLGAVRDERTGRVTDFRSCAPTQGPGYRLPTEAEWECACRAGTETPFHFGETADGTQANVDANRPGGVKAGAFLGRPAKVGSYAANAFGLYDMHGNVWELCEDRYDPGRYKALAGKVADGSPHESGGGLARGGAWNFPPQDARSAARMAVTAQLRYPFVGFRVARNAE
jgi:formylglycine-generating enzyme required for sulfatase activity